MSNDTRPLLTRQEVAELLGVSPVTVSRLITAGKLDTVPVGKRFVRVTRVSLESYINNQKKESK